MCPGCDMVLPDGRSEKLQQLIAEMMEAEQSSGAFDPPWMHWGRVCYQHHVEEGIIPKSSRDIWPTLPPFITFEDLPDRIKQPNVMGRVQELFESPMNSIFFHIIARNLKNKGQRVLSESAITEYEWAGRPG